MIPRRWSNGNTHRPLNLHEDDDDEYFIEVNIGETVESKNDDDSSATDDEPEIVYGYPDYHPSVVKKEDDSSASPSYATSMVEDYMTLGSQDIKQETESEDDRKPAAHVAEDDPSIDSDVGFSSNNHFEASSSNERQIGYY
jgi:hypothetical protein